MGYSRAKVTFQRYYSDVKNLTTDNLQTFFEDNLWIITQYPPVECSTKDKAAQLYAKITAQVPFDNLKTKHR